MIKPKVTEQIRKMFNESREFQRFLDDISGVRSELDDLLADRLIFVSVADITSPSELNLLEGNQNGVIAVAFNGDDITLYAFTQTVIIQNLPYIASGSSGSWVAIAGNYVYAGYRFTDVNGMTPGYIPFADSNGELTENTDLSWNNTSKILLIGGIANTEGRIKSVVSGPASPYTIDINDEVVYANTTAGNITLNLPAGTNGEAHKIINCGSGGNRALINPNGAELLFGLNSQEYLTDGENIEIVYNTSYGWH